MTKSRNNIPREPDRATRPLDWLLWAAVMIAAMTRALATSEPFPHFDADPLIQYVPRTGFTPSFSLALDTLLVLLASLTVLRARSGTPELGLVVVGAVALVIHRHDGPTGLSDLERGMPWAGALAAGVAVRAMSLDPRLRRLTLAVGFGVIAMVIVKGVWQITIEHASTVEAFRRDPESFLAAQGWRPDSAQARSFERRLNQPEATGWFGLANVFASFASAMLAGGIVAIAGSLKHRTDLAISAGLALLGGAALWMSGSKGGLGAGVVGAIVGLATLGLPRLAWARRLALPAAIAAALAALVVRGLVGESLGELSLLFRWFYVETATEIFAGSPLVGVGPDGFQTAYVAARPDISPEAVSSPHSVAFDWLATLGLFGLAWLILLGRWAWTVSSDPAKSWSDAPIEKAETRALLAVLGTLTLIGGGIEIALLAAEPGQSILRILSLALGLAAAWGVLRLGTAGAGLALGAAAALLVHAQIEVTPVLVGSAPVFAVLIAGAAGPDASTTSERTRRPWHRAARVSCVAGGVALAAWAALLGVVPFARWESALDRAAVPIRELPAFERRTRSGFIEAGRRTDQHLERAIEIRAGHAATRSSRVRLLIALANANADGATALAAIGEAQASAEIRPDEAGRWLELASAIRAASAIEQELAAPGASLPDRTSQAREALERAAEIDRSAIAPAWRLFLLAREGGDDGAARRWAEELAKRDEMLRLDPLIGLDEAQRAGIRRWLGP
ncbi:MAG: O-antigen ligase family protein [Planctomycetota bacterium]